MNVEIVLYEPEIPQNTGNIMRTCVALGVKLHLIEPLGFKIDESRLKRSALDYYEHLDYVTHKNFDDFASKNPGTYLFLTRYGKKNYADINYKSLPEPLYLIFGKESTGVDRKLLAKHLDNCYRIPTTDKVRSLNLSNAVAIVAYEVFRQFDYENLITVEPDTHKGKDFLDQFLEDK
ncbi:MAG: RNA methyltransferase [Tenericutes bacterium GWC2_34_14]|nr:MAG: RNA methyltransferase [Tenericutes bacterium GWA2_35_7]OHE29340.1 MAG: RNA methyltransferase [Tenericutes bacterium GWC2_34_14]OHE34437.1 MAG: RNA methyltransferase [Tenericutes bacterium GWE2_34_108]OHE35793.1 MAG: RNA methyltransferase [Tenericutes bacterium GWF1_35_14]OHE39120.1 MAG: RNA methyltransferase [Tenericutes bacterium GWF2_35_184]OHE42813.1 MAG: RNA methyltransferase [Tenericutes bacterium RIFOXYA2_FULL_36_32]OHE46041.1 MAG: RNA methyltransferase [Tenericutes bacterium RI